MTAILTEERWNLNIILIAKDYIEHLYFYISKVSAVFHCPFDGIMCFLFVYILDITCILDTNPHQRDIWQRFLSHSAGSLHFDCFFCCTEAV
jgi:hypothetical protein